MKRAISMDLTNGIFHVLDRLLPSCASGSEVDCASVLQQGHRCKEGIRLHRNPVGRLTVTPEPTAPQSTRQVRSATISRWCARSWCGCRRGMRRCQTLPHWSPTRCSPPADGLGGPSPADNALAGEAGRDRPAGGHPGTPKALSMPLLRSQTGSVFHRCSRPT